MLGLIHFEVVDGNYYFTPTCRQFMLSWMIGKLYMYIARVEDACGWEV